MSKTNPRPAAALPALLALAVLGTLMAPATAHADLRPPVNVELLGPPRAARAGEPFVGTLRLTAGEPGRIDGLALGGDDWQMVRLSAPADQELAKGQELTAEFTAIPRDPDGWLVVTLHWNGYPVRKSFDLSERGVKRALGVVPVRQTRPDDGQAPAPAARVGLAPEPAAGAAAPRPGDDPDARLQDDDPSLPARTAGAKITVRVRGKFVYEREADGIEIGVDGATVEIWDDDPVGDDHLVDTVTDTEGFFDITFTFDDYWESYPDIYLKLRAGNGEVEVEDATWGIPYVWETAVRRDVESYCNFGELQSSDESLVPALHILTNITRTWRWSAEKGYDPRGLDVQWPDGEDDGAWYDSYRETIHVSGNREWNEGTHSHEWGHHWINCYALLQAPDYCNGYCDEDEPSDCGHCLWCRENTHDAWNEGFPDYFGYVIPGEFLTRYGAEALFRTQVGGLDTCGVDNAIHEATITEGFVGACLVDLADASEDNHPIAGSWRDRVALGDKAVLDAVAELDPTAAQPFWLALKARFPTLVQPLWETCRNCNFEIDTADPGAPGSVWSTTHSTGIPSPAAVARFQWTAASDDASGVNRYSVEITVGAPGLPMGGPYVDGDRIYETDPLSPGTYYFNVRAIDRAGNWSDTYRSYGPFTVREPTGSDLEFRTLAGWDYPVVPRGDATATAAAAAVSATLPGNAALTYWNVIGRNAGESATEAAVQGRVHVDDVAGAASSLGVVAAGANLTLNNRGPMTVRGGRHTLHYWLDATDVAGETDENDNDWGHQFVWTPLVLEESVVVTRTVPRHYLRGWQHVSDGSPLYYNCDGLRFDNSGWWNAVVVWCEAELVNLDVRLHHVSTGAQNGFTTYLDRSTRPLGCLDAVIVNRNSTATARFDVGVINGGLDITQQYSAVHVENDWVDYDFPATFTLGPDHWLQLLEVSVLPGDVGPVSVVVTTDPPTPNVNVQWRNYDFVLGGLLDCDAAAATGVDGTAILQHTVADAGYHSVLLYRDPRDGTADVDVTIRVRRTPPDFEPFWAAGWHSPFTPRPAADGTTTAVALPDTLHGNAARTYYNLALWNNSPAAAESLRVYTYLDEVPGVALLYPTFPAYANARFNWATAQIVRGGRHTLAHVLDRDNDILELQEDDNWYAEQYCWSPLALAAGSVQARVAPPARNGGWKWLPESTSRWYNCDGLRLPQTTAYWAALAVMPGDTSNVDVRLHQPLAGAQAGFGSSLAYSGWGEGQSDFVLVNFNHAARRPYDVGALAVKGGQAYTAQAVREVFIPVPSGQHGPYTMPPSEILDLYELFLPAGPCAFSLLAVDRQVDWGFSLYPADGVFVGKSGVVGDGIGWQHGPGADESFGVDIPAVGYYCLAVWKCGPDDLPREGKYSFRVYPGVTATPEDGIPALTALVGIRPNPFNPQTTISFDLATSGPVALAVYDLAGSLVRTLLDEPREAGRHDVVWDGRNDAGRPVASGVYMARLATGEVKVLRKLTLVK